MSPRTTPCAGPVADVAPYQLTPITGVVGITGVVMNPDYQGSYSGTGVVTATVPGNAVLRVVMRYTHPTPGNYIAHVIVDNPGSGYDSYLPPASPPPVSFSIGGAQATSSVGTIPPVHFPITDYDFSFHRKTSWSTRVRRYQDQSSVELWPYQAVAMYEFGLHSDVWTQDDATNFDALVDSVQGAAYPMWITAPDDGQIYVVRFKDDPQSYTFPGAVVRSVDIILVTVGDVDNSIINSEIYPPTIPGPPGAPIGPSSG